MDGLIEKQDVRSSLVGFYHMYAICTRDKDVVMSKLVDGESIFEAVTPSDAAFASLLYVDNYGGWVDTIEKQRITPSYKNPRENKTRWNKVSGKTSFRDRVGKEAKAFYDDSLTLFECLHEENPVLQDMLKSDSKEWVEANMAAKKVKRRKAGNKALVEEDSAVNAPSVNASVFAAFTAFKKRKLNSADPMSVIANAGTNMPALPPPLMNQGAAL